MLMYHCYCFWFNYLGGAFKKLNSQTHSNKSQYKEHVSQVDQAVRQFYYTQNKMTLCSQVSQIKLKQ